MLGPSLFLLAISSFDPAAAATGPIFSSTTAKPLEAFGQCFISAQQARNNVWWFVPDEQGGRFSNAGAKGVTDPFRVIFRKNNGTSQVRVFANVTASQAEPDVVSLVKSCT